MPKCRPFTVPMWHWRRTSATRHLGTSSCNTFGSPHLLLTNFRYTSSSCTSNASKSLRVTSNTPSISSFVGLWLYVRRNCTIQLNSGSDRCFSMRLSITEEVSTPSDEEYSSIRSIEFTLNRLPMYGSVASGVRLKPSAIPCRFPLRRFLYRLLSLCNSEFAFPGHAELATNRCLLMCPNKTQ